MFWRVSNVFGDILARNVSGALMKICLANVLKDYSLEEILDQDDLLDNCKGNNQQLLS